MPRLRRSAMAAGPSVAVDGRFGHRRRPWAGTTPALATTQEARRAVGEAILVGPTAGPPPGGPGGPPLNSLCMRPLVPRTCNQLQSVVDMIRLAAAFFVGGIGRSPASRGPNSQSPSTAHLIRSTSRGSHSSWPLPPLMVVVARRVAAPASA